MTDEINYFFNIISALNLNQEKGIALKSEGIVKDSLEYAGKVVELQAMEIDKSAAIPSLRHAKIINWRVDKNKEDCDWSQLE